MKKILTVFMFLLGFILFSSCTNASDSPRDSYGFKNTTEQTKEEIQEKIAFYSNRMITSSQSKMSLNKSLSHTFFSVADSLSIPFLRDELPPRKEYHRDFDMIDPIFVQSIGNRLKTFHDRLNFCDEFVEDVFCTFKIENTEMMIKVRNEENQLYIEVISFSKSVNASGVAVYVTTAMIYLNLIDDKIRYEEVNDSKSEIYGEKSHLLIYNLYNESGDIIKIKINMLNNHEFYYHQHDSLAKTNFWFSNTNNEMYVNHTDLISDKYHALQFRDDEIIKLTVGYEFYNSLFTYIYTTESGTPRIDLKWDLLQVTGWDKALISDRGSDSILKENVELLTDFKISIITSKYTDANASINIPAEELTENLINLSDYGLSFTKVTLEQINLDIPFLEDNYRTLIEEKGLFLEIEKNKEILLNFIPFYADEDIVNDLFEKMLFGH
ncbi:MAG: hypothetical protein Q7I99_05155 [Acholeplasmataceae bacterium]|nr:hypothetical protein [Acholeplasmataceae bacterium]